MPVTYSTGAKNARMTAVRDLCADGTLELLTSNDTVLLSLGLSTAGGSVTGGIWTVTFDGAAAATGTGTAAKARVKNAAGTVVVDGLVVNTTGGNDAVRLDNTSIATGQSVNPTSMTIAHF